MDDEHGHKIANKFLAWPTVLGCQFTTLKPTILSIHEIKNLGVFQISQSQGLIYYK